MIGLSESLEKYRYTFSNLTLADVLVMDCEYDWSSHVYHPIPIDAQQQRGDESMNMLQ